MNSRLFDIAARDTHYATNIRGGINAAQYLLDLHDAKATFNFCGGMLFQLSLTDALRKHLQEVSKQQADASMPRSPFVTIFDQTYRSMASLAGYEKSAFSDNLQIFHGREIRKVPSAAGGMGFVLQLCLAGHNDPQGWTPPEVEGYDGWGHDARRQWRSGHDLVSEGYETFQKEFGQNAFALHHRFILHYDKYKRLWLSAEDGCEGCIPH